MVAVSPLAGFAQETQEMSVPIKNAVKYVFKQNVMHYGKTPKHILKNCSCLKSSKHIFLKKTEENFKYASLKSDHKNLFKYRLVNSAYLKLITFG